MNKYLFILASCLFLSSCGHESLEERAEREAKEFTQKYCPTPVSNFTRTDSVIFNKNTRTYTYYCSFSDRFDDKKVIDQNYQKIKEGLAKGISDNTSLRVYKDAGFNFQYICHSTKNPKETLFKAIYTKKEYNK
ncbi:hypothetical protein [Prevotella sp.]|uniref:hypothetical protein n=1 Tax=Prevotella sp. TaxID=59823 RepID=UPI002F956BC2